MVVQKALSDSLQQTPSVLMASDVKSIVLRYNERRKSGYYEKKRSSILRQPGPVNREYGHVIIPQNERNEMLIGVDDEKRIQHLRRVPFKQSSRSPRRKRKSKKKS
ncbi:hypothetical protein RB195_016364 [Necator americanus]|uniref:Uncharacterized protein n=1 Tax=Necator americanus TaxID=51031 RepID=A0ABR1EBE1_NECAM